MTSDLNYLELGMAKIFISIPVILNVIFALYRKKVYSLLIIIQDK